MESLLRRHTVLCAVVSLVLFAEVLASPMQTYNSNYPNRSHGSNNLKGGSTIPEVNIEKAVRQDEDLSICEKKKESSVFAFGRCPESCEPFSTDLFITCSGMVQFGCELQPCGAGQFTCSLKEDLSDDVTVCPGDKIIFDSVELEKLQRVRFSIDLKANPVKTDFYLLSDATGSMSSAIETAKEKFQGIVDAFATRPNVAFGVGFYRDENELDRGFENVQPLTTEVKDAKAAVNTLSATGGVDADEANLVALYRVATDPAIGWRKGSRKILVYFGDNPGHEPTCVKDLPELTRDVVIDALNDEKITVIAASFKNESLPNIAPGLDGPTTTFGCSGAGSGAGAGQGTKITEGTAGKLVASEDQEELITVITSALKTLSRTFDVDETECKEDITSVHNPELPLTVPPGGKTTVTNTLSVKPAVCESKGRFECNYRYSERGADLEKTTVELVNIKGCPSF